MKRIWSRRRYFLLSAILLVAASCLAPTIAAQTCTGPGTERWPIKTSVPDGTDLAQAKPVGLKDLLSLTQPNDVKHNDPRFQDARIPNFSNSLNVKEGDLLTTTGWLYLVATETDCDYHIQISNQPRTTTDKPTPDDDCVVVEAPKPDFVSNIDLQQRVTTARTYIGTKIMHGAEPSNTGSVMIHAVCVQVTGQLFYDDSHVGKNGQVEIRGKKGMHSHTLWELHPITDFNIVPAPNCTF